MESTKEAAARIRAFLKKEKGWNARDVTIRTEYFSMGSSIHATIRNARVPGHELKAILESGEQIHRDEYTGEILGGGNRYVHLHWTEEVQEILARRHVDALQVALGSLEELEDGSLVPIAGTDPMAYVGWENGKGFGIRVWTERPELAFNRVRPNEPGYERWLRSVSFELAVLLERRRAERAA